MCLNEHFKMTTSELQNSKLIVELLQNRGEAAKLSFLVKKLEISKSEAVYLLEKYILPNKLLNNLDAKNPGSFVLIATNRTKYLLETKVLESLFKAQKRKRTDELLASRNLRIKFLFNVGAIITFIVSVLVNIFFFWKIITQ